MSESQLQIVISVINNAAGQLAEVGTQLSALAEETAADASDMSASMSGAATSMTDSLTSAEDAVVAAAEASLSQWTDAAEGIATAVEDATPTIDEAFNSLAETNAAAAARVQAAWAEDAASMEADLASALNGVDEDFDKTAEVASTAAGEMESSVSSVGGKIQAVGIQLGILGAAFAAPAVEAVKAAGDQTDAFDQLGNTVKNVYASASAPTAGLATEVADLTAKINTEKATIAEAAAGLQKWTGTTAEVAANHEKAAASIQTAQVNLQKYQQQLDQLTQSEQLVGGSVADTTAQFEAAARANTNLGFTASDSANALQFLFASTNSVSETMSAYQDAMDLARAKNIDLNTASNDVIQAMNGQGRALRDLGVNVADGLSGQTALAAIQAKVAGSAEDAATHGLGPYNVATANLNKAMADFGTTVLPLLASFLEYLSEIITKVDGWAQAHPKLAEALLIFSGLLGGILIILGAVLVPFGLLIIGIEAFNTALIALNVTMFAAIGATLLYVAAFVAIVAIVALIIVYHQQIMAAIKAAWDWIINEVSNAMLAAYNAVDGGLKNINKTWTDIWNGVVSFLGTIWNDIGAAVQKGINFVEGIINNFATTIQGIYNKIMAPINAITGAVSSVSGGVGGVLGGAIKAFASGGIVNGPTLALVGEAGPEAIIPLSAFSGGSSLAGGGGTGSGGNIVVNINGGSYLDSQGATMIANALATQIQRQLRLKNYA
jgi:hypothetical protein